MTDVHPKRAQGFLYYSQTQWADLEEAPQVLKIPVNHHNIYYRKMFEAMEISAKKNHDYAGGLQEHPLGNFLKTADSGIDPKIGLWVRMTDKIGRITTFFKEGTLKVDGEGIEDAFMDLGNYCFLMLALLSEDNDG